MDKLKRSLDISGDGETAWHDSMYIYVKDKQVC